MNGCLDLSSDTLLLQWNAVTHCPRLAHLTLIDAMSLVGLCRTGLCLVRSGSFMPSMMALLLRVLQRGFICGLAGHSSRVPHTGGGGGGGGRAAAGAAAGTGGPGRPPPYISGGSDHIWWLRKRRREQRD